MSSLPAGFAWSVHRSFKVFCLTGSMRSNYTLCFLKTKWQSYIEKRGHYIYKSKPDTGLVRSRNRCKKRYRWLLMVSKRAIHRLSISEQAYIRQNILQAKIRGEAVYLVVGFTRLPRRIVVLPAKAALKAKCVRSDKGGIAWED